MIPIRERIADAIGGSPRKQLHETARDLMAAYDRRTQIETREVDQRTAWNVSRHANDILLSGDPADEGITEQERLKGVSLSRRMYHWDVMYKSIIRLWTNFGFGRTVSVTCRDDRAQEVWGEFWDANRNSRWLGERLHTLSHRILVDGEFFPTIFTSKSTGLSTLRIVKTDQIGEILTLPDDQDMPVWYRRTWTPAGQETSVDWYYPHWGADVETRGAVPLGDGQIEAESEQAVITMQHAILPGLFPRGVPLLLAGQVWFGEYADFLSDRRSLTKLVAMFAEDITATGGSRAIDAVKGFFNSSFASGSDSESNPPPAVGAPFVHNDAVSRKRSPLTTGASDAMSDGAMFLGQVGMSGGIYPHYLGMGEAFRLATATSMEWPSEVQWELYRNLWATIWRNMVKCVLKSYSDVTGEQFDDMSTDVSTDALVRPKMTDVAATLKTLYLDPVSSGADPLIPYKVAITQALRILNVPDSADLVEQMVTDKETDEQNTVPTEAYEQIEQLYQEALTAATTDDERTALGASIELVRGAQDE